MDVLRWQGGRWRNGETDARTIDRDILLVLSEGTMLSAITYDAALGRFVSLFRVTRLLSTSSKPRLNGRMLCVDSWSRAVAVCSFQTSISFFPVCSEAQCLRSEALSHSVDGVIWSASWLWSDIDSPLRSLAVLVHRSNTCAIEVVQLDFLNRVVESTRTLTLNDLTFAPSTSFFTSTNSPMILRVNHVPDQPNALLLMTDSSVVFCDVSAATPVMATVAYPAVSFVRTAGAPLVSAVAWDENSRCVVTFDTGHLFCLKYTIFPTTLQFLPLGSSVSSSFILPLPSSRLLVVGDFMDSEILMVDWDKMEVDSSGSQLMLNETVLKRQSEITNLSPIIDSSLVDVNGEGQDLIYTASGQAPGSTVRLIRNGIGVHTFASLEGMAEGLNGLWTLRLDKSHVYHSLVVMSFVSDTRILRDVGAEVLELEEMETSQIGFDSSVSTLQAANVIGNVLFQAHPGGIIISAVQESTNMSSGHGQLEVVYKQIWTPSKEVSLVATSVSSSLEHRANGRIVAALSNSEVVLLQVAANGHGRYELSVLASCSVPSAISCVELPVEPFADILLKDFILIGTYSSALMVFAVEGTSATAPAAGVTSLNLVQTIALESLSDEEGLCIPHSTRVLWFEKSPSVFVGLRNGSLIRFDLQVIHQDQRVPSDLLSGPFCRRLGVTPISLVRIDSATGSSDPHGSSTVHANHVSALALAERPWHVYSMRTTGRVALSSLSFSEVSYAATFSSPSSPHALIAVSQSTVNIISLKETKRLNVTKYPLPVDSTARRIVYHSQSGKLILSCFKHTHAGIVSDIRIMDPLSGKIYSIHSLRPRETLYSLTVWETAGTVFVCIGTALANTTTGRLVLFQVIKDVSTGVNAEGGEKTRRAEWKLDKVTEAALPGAVVCVRPHQHDLLLASAANKFWAFSLTGAMKLTTVAESATRHLVVSISSKAGRILIGDQRDSIQFWNHVDSEFHLNYADSRPRLLCDGLLLDEDVAVGCDKFGSFFSLRYRDHESLTPEITVPTDCYFSLRETVTHLRRGSLVYRGSRQDIHGKPKSSAEIVLAPTLLGSVIALLKLDPSENLTVLTALQECLAVQNSTQPLLGNDLKTYRSELQPMTGVVDGDFVSQFLDVTQGEQIQIVSALNASWGLGLSVDQVISLIESINQKIH
eukprot:GILJ01014752.1.p1 GENE.GILJ01014752.1~~GILJ01014752.1.p1  ORF type:complete len:1187 (+),score=193.24 GILJ01014752.1:90-3563(+)